MRTNYMIPLLRLFCPQAHSLRQPAREVAVSATARVSAIVPSYRAVFWFGVVTGRPRRGTAFRPFSLSPRPVSLPSGDYADFSHHSMF